MHIEHLEPRIAPAAVFTFTDVDGDLVTVKSSKGTNPQLEATLMLSNSGMGRKVDQITLTAGVYQGADFSIEARTPAGGIGDGLVHIAKFSAAGVHLGKVKIDGDLLDATMGDSAGTGPGVKSLLVHTLGFQASATAAGITLNKGVGSLEVKAGLFGQNSLTIEGPAAKVVIGGDIRANGTDLSSFINIAGSVGTLLIKGSIVGDAKDLNSSFVITGDVKSLTVLGAIIGGTGNYSGNITVVGKVGTLNTGSILQQMSEGSGSVFTTGSIGTATVGGMIANLTVGGTATPAIAAGWNKMTANVAGNASIGSLTIKGFAGFGNMLSVMASGSIGKVVLSEVGNFSVTAGGNIASVLVKGNTIQFGIGAHGTGKGPAIGNITALGNLNAFIGAGVPVADGQAADLAASIGKITVGGVLKGQIGAGAGDPMSPSSRIAAITAKGGAFDTNVLANEIGPVTIAGSKLPLAAGPDNDDDRLFGTLAFDEV